MPNTGVSLITSTDDIAGVFARKRFLMNTYADAASFLAMSRGMIYLYEAVSDKAINDIIADYLILLKRLLVLEYGYTMTEMDQWSKVYRTRLANQEIPRPLSTVARNFWSKMSAEERFIQPVLQMMARGESVAAAVPFLATLIKAGDSELSPHEIFRKLEAKWRKNPFGETLLMSIQAEMR